MIIFAIVGDNTENISYIKPFVLPEGHVIMLESRPDPSFHAGGDGYWLPWPSPSQKIEIVAEAKITKSKLMKEASDKIETLKDRIEMGESREAELKEWKRYRITLDDIDTSVIPVIFPNMPTDK